MRRLATPLTATAYLAAIVGANLLINHFGPDAIPYVSFVLVAPVLVLRNRFADMVGPRRYVPQVALILAGAVVTWLLNRHAATIAVASVAAFVASESVEAVNYIAMSHRPWLERAPISATIGAALDSVLFVTVAFGFDFRVVFIQWIAKTAGGWLWSQLIADVRKRALLPRNA